MTQRILGLDPGETTGWCVYAVDDIGACVEECGTFPGSDIPDEVDRAAMRSAAIVLERPRGYGPTRPELVECGIVFGQLYEQMVDRWGYVDWLLRKDVCKILSDATHGVVRVRNDATAWAALVLLHGDGSDRKPRRKKGEVVDAGGPLGQVKSHARAALAVAVAWHLRQTEVAK